MSKTTCITEAEYDAIQVDARLTLRSGATLEVLAFPDGRPWGKEPGKPSRPVAREEIARVRQPGGGGGAAVGVESPTPRSLTGSANTKSRNSPKGTETTFSESLF